MMMSMMMSYKTIKMNKERCKTFKAKSQFVHNDSMKQNHKYAGKYGAVIIPKPY